MDRLARAYHDYGASIPSSANRAASSDKTIVQFLDTAEALNKMRDPAFRADATRHPSRRWWGCGRSWSGSRPFRRSQADAAFSGIAASFAADPQQSRAVRRRRARRPATAADCRPVRAGDAASRRSAWWTCSAGARRIGRYRGAQQVAQEIERILEAQRMVSLDTMFDLADNLEGLSRGEKLNAALVNQTGRPHRRNPAAARLSDRRREERHGLRLLDRQAHRSRAQAQPARGHRKGRRPTRRS